MASWDSLKALAPMVAMAPHQFAAAWQVRQRPLPNAALLQRKGVYDCSGIAQANCSKRELRGEKGPVVVIVPGWLSESSQYHQMATHLRSKGVTALIVPLKWFNWIPSLGGRSVRPILDRIHATITRALTEDEEAILESVDELDYTFSDFFKEFINPKNGAQPLQDSLTLKNESTLSNLSAKRVILVAHSAGGWICRILLGGKVLYDGCAYAASRYVRALVTLGTPHVCTDKLTKRNMDFVNENYPGTAEAEEGVHYICVAGKFVQGKSQYGGLWKDFAWQSYELCCGKGDLWGDGVIPLDCALSLEGAQHVILEGVEHFPSVRDEQNRRWYGSSEVVDEWFPLLSSREQESVVKSTVL